MKMSKEYMREWKRKKRLDVWNNLQVIPLVENKRKHNNYEDSSGL